MSDIVKRLEDMFFRFGAESPDDAAKRRIQTAKDAADEIEKLRAALNKARHDALKEAAQIAAHHERMAYQRGDLPLGDPNECAAQVAREIEAAIRALSDTLPGNYVNEIEQERDEFFNRLGRITEELRLPMDATASRIIDAVRDRVDNEREACASVSVQVKVPEGAETWTPLEAWEEALLVFDEAFRNAIRSRALGEKE
jgi:hypothetical protein